MTLTELLVGFGVRWGTQNSSGTWQLGFWHPVAMDFCWREEGGRWGVWGSRTRPEVMLGRLVR